MLLVYDDYLKQTNAERYCCTIRVLESRRLGALHHAVNKCQLSRSADNPELHIFISMTFRFPFSQ